MTAAVCLECGTPSGLPDIRPDDRPFVYLLLLAFSAVMGFYVLDRETPYRFLTTCAFFVVLAILYRLWTLRRADRWQPLRPDPVCPRGCSAEIVPLPEVRGRVLPCPECGERTVTWSRWGV